MVANSVVPFAQHKPVQRVGRSSAACCAFERAESPIRVQFNQTPLYGFALCASVVLLLACLLSAASVATAFAAVGDVFDASGITYKVISEEETPAVSVGVGTQAGAMTSATGNISIPQTVTRNGVAYEVLEVSKYAFSAGSGKGSAVTSVTLPESITAIGDYAFCSCESLASFSVPASVEKIGMYAFANCHALSSFTFEEPFAEEPRLSLGEGFLRSSKGVQDALTYIELPKRIFGIPSAAFQFQEAIQEVRFIRDSITSIGSYAFLGCCSVRTLELPELTSSGANLGTHALYGMRDLETIIFKCNQDYGTDQMPGNTAFSTGSFNLDSYATADSRYPDVKTIVYYGNHSANLFPEANHYQRITYFASEDAFANNEPLGDVFVRNDVVLRDVSAKVGQADDKGVFVLEGVVPVVDGADSWRFVGFTPSSVPTGYVRAIACPSNNLASGEIVLDNASLVLANWSVAPSYRVLNAWGTELVEDVDYQTYIQKVKVMEDEEGESTGEIEIIETLPSLEVSSPGNYILVAEAVNGTGLTGSISVAFEVIGYSCTWTRASGDANYSTPNHMADTAFARDEVDTVILANVSAPAVGAAAGGLAGVRQAPIVATDGDALTMEAKRTLTWFTPDSVILIGFTDASTVMVQVSETLNANVSVSNAFVADTPGLISYQAYARTKRSGYWDNTTTAFVASANDAASAALAGSYAYRLKCPVFLADDGTAVPDVTAKALVDDGFQTVTLVGLDSGAAAAVKAQLVAAGFTGEVAVRSAQSAYELSESLVGEQMKRGLCAPDQVTVVHAADANGLITAPSTTGQNAAPLIVVENPTVDSDALLSWLNSQKYRISQGYLFGPRAYLPAELQDCIERLWIAFDATNMCWAEVTLDKAIYDYDGNVHKPDVTVKDAKGVELVKDTDYSIRYYDDMTDRLVFYDDANNKPESDSHLVPAGSYTVIVSGIGNYTGRCSASLRIVLGSLAKATVALSSSEFEYCGSALKPAANVTFGGKQLAWGIDYEISYSNNVDAGQAEATITGVGAYTGEVVRDFAINPCNLATATSIQTLVQQRSYTGKRIKPSIQIAVGLDVLQEGVDYTLNYPKAINAGSYQAEVQGVGNYAGNLLVPFKVAKASQTIKLSPAKKTIKASKLKKEKVTFTIKAKAKTKVSYSVQNRKAKRCISVTKKGKVTVKKGAKKGSYKITVKAAAAKNYKSASKAFTIKIR